MSRDAAHGVRAVRGRVVDADGRAVEGVELNLFSCDSKSGARTRKGRTTSLADGSFEAIAEVGPWTRVVLDARPRPDQALRAADDVETDRFHDVEVRLARGAGVVVRTLDAEGGPLGGDDWRLWLDSTLPGWPPRDRRAEYDARLEALNGDSKEFEKFAALPGSVGGPVPADGRIAFGGLECGAYWVQLSRVFPERRRVVPSVVSVERGDADVVDGALVLNGAATVVVRAAAPT